LKCVGAQDPEGGPESSLWAAVVERGQDARTARPTKKPRFRSASSVFYS
jgi:hypothetical protein